MKSNRILVRAACVVAVALTPLLAVAGDQAYSPAAICSVSPAGTMTFGSQGQITNPAAGAMTQSANCGLGQDNLNDANDDVVIRYNDATTGGALFCGIVENNLDWSTVVFGDQRWACSTFEGCAAMPPATFTGIGTIRLTDIAHGGTMISTMTCNIPGGSSQIRTIQLDEQ
jgi:hypothetical protein